MFKTLLVATVMLPDMLPPLQVSVPVNTLVPRKRAAGEVELAMGTYLNRSIDGKGLPRPEDALRGAALLAPKTSPATVGLTSNVTL